MIMPFFIQSDKVLHYLYVFTAKLLTLLVKIRNPQWQFSEINLNCGQYYGLFLCILGLISDKMC